MPYPAASSNLGLYHAFKWLVVSPCFHGLFRIRAYGTEQIPKGPFVAVSGHASVLDPLLVANCVGRPTAFMAKEELFDIPLLGPTMRMYGAFPVKRGTADRSALRSALEAIEAGWVVGLFLEGTRTPDGRIHQPQPGAALISAKTGVPLLPVSIWGSGQILPRGQTIPQLTPVTVRFGELIPPPSSSRKEDLSQTSTRCGEQINQMLDLGR